jgi:spore coat protein U-like protein
VLIGATGAALAADSATLNVVATVNQICRFKTGPNPTVTLDFGNLDPVGAPAVNVSTSLLFNCNGIAPTFVAGNGNHFSGGTRNMANGALLIPYSLVLAAGGLATDPITTDRTLTIDGSIPVGSYTNYAAGAYTDSVQIQLTP